MLQDKLHVYVARFYAPFSTLLCNRLSETLPSGLIQSTWWLFSLPIPGE